MKKLLKWLLLIADILMVLLCAFLTYASINIIMSIISSLMNTGHSIGASMRGEFEFILFTGIMLVASIVNFKYKRLKMGIIIALITAELVFMFAFVKLI